jgi:hypothetical protein
MSNHGGERVIRLPGPVVATNAEPRIIIYAMTLSQRRSVAAGFNPCGRYKNPQVRQPFG